MIFPDSAQPNSPRGVPAKILPFDKPDRKDLFDGSPMISPLIREERASDHSKASPSLYKFPHTFKINRFEVEVGWQIVKNQEIETLKLFREESFNGKGYQALLLERHIDDIGRGPQDDERKERVDGLILKGHRHKTETHTGPARCDRDPR